MKTLIRAFALGMLLFAISCTDNVPQETEPEYTSSISTKSIDSDYADLLKTDWYNMSHLKLHNNLASVPAPWSTNQGGALPFHIIEDFLPESGWELINETISEGVKDYSYLMFMNRYTGKIRVLYYHEEVVAAGGTGAWQLKFSSNTSLLNIRGFFAFPDEIKDVNGTELIVTNNTENRNQAIGRGWNCFETELNYDASIGKNSNKYMGITSYNTNITKINLNGDYTSKSSGTIISITNQNPVKSGFNVISTSLGDSAKTWITSNIAKNVTDKHPIKIGVNALAAIAQNGVKGIVDSGIDKIFGSFIGIFNKKTPTKQKLEFTTTGKATYNGELVEETSNNVMGWNAIPAYNLGLWSIDRTPAVVVGKYGLWRDNTVTTPPYYLEKRYYLDESSFNVCINPQYKEKIKNLSCIAELLYFEKVDGKYNWRYDYRNAIPMNYTDNSHGYFPSQKLLYESADASLIIKDAGASTDGIELYETNTRPTAPFVEIPGLSPNYVVRVTLKFDCEDGSTVVLGRNYIPKFVQKDNSINPFSLEENLLMKTPTIKVEPKVIFQ